MWHIQVPLLTYQVSLPIHKFSMLIIITSAAWATIGPYLESQALTSRIVDKLSQQTHIIVKISVQANVKLEPGLDKYMSRILQSNIRLSCKAGIPVSLAINSTDRSVKPDADILFTSSPVPDPYTPEKCIFKQKVKNKLKFHKKEKKNHYYRHSVGITKSHLFIQVQQKNV